MLITNLTIETMSAAGLLRGGWILIENGKITDIGDGELPGYDGEIFNGEGLTAYPGFIDAHTHLGIVEDSLDFEGDDCNEDSDPITPHVRALDGINPLDRCFSEARLAGITCVAVAPGSANPIGGQVCVIKTAGKRVDKMVIKAPAAIKFALGENPKNTYHSKNSSPVTRMATAALMRENLAKAKRYSDDLARSENDDEIDPPEYDIKLEALLPLLRGEISAHFHAHRADDIFTAIRISEEFGIGYVIVHGTEGHLIADELCNVPVIAGPNLCDRSKPELREQTFKNPAALMTSGALVALTTDHPVSPLNFLPICAAMAKKEGLSRTAALEALTINPARILGIDSRVGSLEAHKDADIVLVRGDVLSIDHTVEAVFINGEKIK
ncbi:MAG: amidohydrolase [Clostridia bacterium]|nr:amidohydrolase [Clostridia bacterium]